MSRFLLNSLLACALPSGPALAATVITGAFDQDLKPLSNAETRRVAAILRTEEL